MKLNMYAIQIPRQGVIAQIVFDEKDENAEKAFKELIKKIMEEDKEYAKSIVLKRIGVLDIQKCSLETEESPVVIYDGEDAVWDVELENEALETKRKGSEKNDENE